jgi:hypothetical protein
MPKVREWYAVYIPRPMRRIGELGAYLNCWNQNTKIDKNSLHFILLNVYLIFIRNFLNYFGGIFKICLTPNVEFHTRFDRPDSSLKFEICETRRDGTAKGRKQEIGEHDKTNFKVNESYANEGVDN